MKRKQPRRDWTRARAKVEAEGRCRLHRLGDCCGYLEAAHVVAREHDRLSPDQEAMRPKGSDVVWPVRPDRVIPLCGFHHEAYDDHTVDVLPVLSLDEQLRAVRDAGGIALALRRLTGDRNYDRREVA